jgi:hypothetical protein
MKKEERMRKGISQLVLAAVALSTLSAANGSAQTSSTTSDTKKFEVIAVQGNQLVVKLPEGTREITVPDGFKFTVNGQSMSVGELKPGMSGTATITTTTTVTPVTVTEVKNGTIEQVTGNGILVRTDQGYKNFTEADVKKRNVKLFKDGQPVSLTDFHRGDHLSATIVTEKPPQVMTERQVQAKLASSGATPSASGGGASAPAAAPRPAAPPRASASGTAAPARPVPSEPTGTGAAATPKSERKSLPKTASLLPLLGLVGAGSGTIGALLTSRRRRRSTNLTPLAATGSHVVVERRAVRSAAPPREPHPHTARYAFCEQSRLE